MTVRLRVGTRGSPLALWQANQVRTQLAASDSGLGIELIPIRTTGDRITDRPLATIGGKGLFTRELDEALLGHKVAMAVHSLKDLPFRLPDGLELGAVLQRGDARDALVSDGRTLARMPQGSRIGTSSLRRRAQLLASRPDLRVSDLRGNVDTRLRKLDEGQFDGLVLAAAGLERLGHADWISERLDPAFLVPAVGQGAVVVVCRQDDAMARTLLSRLDHKATRVAILAERALLGVVEGNCQVPVGGHAVATDRNLTLRGIIASPDGTQLIASRSTGPLTEPEALGHKLGQLLLDSGGREVLEAIQSHGA